MGERGPGGHFESYSSFQARQERPPQTLKEEVEKMYLEAPTELGREIMGKILEMMNAKERAKQLASYVATADPKDITTYYPEKKLGIVLACDTVSSQTYREGDTVIQRGDRLLQLHLPPRASASSPRSLLRDVSESLQLTSDYINYHQLSPKFITGCTYEPLVSVIEKRYGFKAARVGIPVEWRDRVERVFHRYVDPNLEPKIGFVWSTLRDFQDRIPPSVKQG